MEQVERSHRQLARYLFRFEPGSAGAFRASDRLKLGEEALQQPEAWGEWSMADLLAGVAEREQQLLGWLAAAARGEAPALPPPAPAPLPPPPDPDALPPIDEPLRAVLAQFRAAPEQRAGTGARGAKAAKGALCHPKVEEVAEGFA